jgi:SAM-dependent methyltransferase
MTNAGDSSVVDLAAIKEYWESAALRPVDDDGLRPTARDPYLQQVVEHEMEKWIRPGSRLLDIGCGDGASTLQFARRAASVHGVDYVDRHVAAARRDAEARGVTNVSFAVGDVMDLADTRARIGQADVVITIRCLINLATWANQAQAIDQIAACVEPGGLYLASEGWTEGWEGVNRLRERCGLERMELVKYNRLISRSEFEQAVSDRFDIVRYQNLGFYVFMSRVFQPAFVAPDAPTHLHGINRTAAQLSSLGIGSDAFGEVDYAGVYVLRRK